MLQTHRCRREWAVRSLARRILRGSGGVAPPRAGGRGKAIAPGAASPASRGKSHGEGRIGPNVVSEAGSGQQPAKGRREVQHLIGVLSSDRPPYHLIIAVPDSACRKDKRRAENANAIGNAMGGIRWHRMAVTGGECGCRRYVASRLKLGNRRPAQLHSEPGHLHSTLPLLQN